MLNQQLTANSTQEKKDLKEVTDTWKFIIENTLDYYKIKYPKSNEEVVNYEEIDPRYNRFNELEYAMTNLMTETEEAAYREQNRKFFHLLFISNDDYAIVETFTALLKLNNAISYTDEVMSAAKVREGYYNTLKEKDYIGVTPNDLVRRYKRIYLLRKQTFHNALGVLLNNDHKTDLDSLKKLHSDNADYALRAVDKMVESILQMPSETFPGASTSSTVSDLEKQVKQRENKLKTDYEKAKSDEEKRYNEGLKELARKEEEALNEVLGFDEEDKRKEKEKVKAQYNALRAELRENSDIVLNGEKYSLLEKAGKDLDQLKKILAYEEKALSHRDKIERDLKDPKTHQAIANYMAQKSPMRFVWKHSIQMMKNLSQNQFITTTTRGLSRYIQKVNMHVSF